MQVCIKATCECIYINIYIYIYILYIYVRIHKTIMFMFVLKQKQQVVPSFCFLHTYIYMIYVRDLRSGLEVCMHVESRTQDHTKVYT